MARTDVLPPRPTAVETRIEVALAAAVLFVLTGGISAFLTQRFTDGGPDFERWPYQYPFSLAGLVGAALLGRSLPDIKSTSARVALAAVGSYLAWSLASVQWSIIPHITSSRAITSVGTACFAVWFGTRLPISRQLLAVALAMSVFVAASLVLVFAAPSYGRGLILEPGAGRLRGLTANPNSLGPLCVLSLITFGAMAWTSRDTRVRAGWGVGCCAAMILLIGSQSDTAIGTAGFAVIGFGIMSGIGALRKRGVSGRVVGAGLAAGALVSSLVAWQWFWKLSNLLSGDETFGNRRRIWDQMYTVAELRPWRGWGYWAFWNTTNNGALIRLGSAHNSVIEVYLGLGRIGVVLFMAIVGFAVIGVLVRLWETFNPWTVWLSLVVAALAIGHITESFVLWYSYNWALLCAAAVGCWSGWERRNGANAPVPGADQTSRA